MTQRYAGAVQLERMAEGNCPECGHAPEAHTRQALGSGSLYAGVCGPFGLWREGVEDRIRQYQADVAEAEDPEGFASDHAGRREGAVSESKPSGQTI